MEPPGYRPVFGLIMVATIPNSRNGSSTLNDWSGRPAIRLRHQSCAWREKSGMYNRIGLR